METQLAACSRHSMNLPEIHAAEDKECLKSQGPDPMELSECLGSAEETVILSPRQPVVLRTPIGERAELEEASELPHSPIYTPQKNKPYLDPLSTLYRAQILRGNYKQQVRRRAWNPACKNNNRYNHCYSATSHTNY